MGTMKQNLLGLAVALCLPTVAMAQSVQDQIISQLQAQGFTHIEVTRTLLGRVRLVATSDSLERELVFNPATGQILRDFWEERDGDSRVPRLTNPRIRDNDDRDDDDRKVDDNEVDDTDDDDRGDDDREDDDRDDERDDDERDDDDDRDDDNDDDRDNDDDDDDDDKDDDEDDDDD